MPPTRCPGLHCLPRCQQPWLLRMRTLAEAQAGLGLAKAIEPEQVLSSVLKLDPGFFLL